MSPDKNEGTLPQAPDDESAGAALSDAEREQKLLALAQQYTDEINEAHTPIEEDATNKKWADKFRELGVRSTNNLHVWFAGNGGPFGAYDLDSQTVEDATPAVVYIRELQQDDPELFAACTKAAKENSAEFGSWLDHMKAGGGDQQDLELTLARWKLDLKMTAAFNRMLTYPGASEDILNQLTV